MNGAHSKHLFFLLFTLFLDGEAGRDRWGQGRRGHRHLELLCSRFVSLLRQIFNLAGEERLRGSTIHVLELEYKTYLCLSENNVNVRCRAFEHIWSADDKQDTLGLPNCDSGHTMDRLQTKFRHGLHNPSSSRDGQE